jgi:hypothetical protein
MISSRRPGSQPFAYFAIFEIATHHCDCQHGRNKHQIVDASEGSGTLETKESALLVDAENAIIPMPNMRYRYKPNETTGWREHSVDFSEPKSTILANKNLFSEGPGGSHP